MSTPKAIIVVDIECTCWENFPPPNAKSEIIEIGITPISLKGYSLGESEGIIVKPTKSEVSDFCTRLTTLTPEFVATGISFREAIAKIKEKYRLDRNLWASFGEYDKKKFEEQCKNEMVEYPFANLWLNVKTLFAAQYGISKGTGKALEMMGMTFNGTQHRGVDDSRNIAKMLVKLLNH